jgi:hypothetical protein
MKRLLLLLLLALVVACVRAAAAPQAPASAVLPVLIVDLGAESVKLAVLAARQQQFHDVVLTSDGARRLDNVVAFRHNGTQRLFAGAARSAALRSVATTYASVHLMLGTASRDALLGDVSLLLDADDLSADAKRVRVSRAADVSVETLTAMLLEYCAHVAAKHAGVKMRHALVVVPADFSAAQRQQLRAALLIAELNPLGFILNTQAVALAFAINQGVALPPDETRTVALVDIGASLASVAIAQVTKSTMRILSTVSDRSISGRAFDRRLAQLVVQKAAGAAIRVTPLLLDSVARAKRVLSVNREATIKVGDTQIVPVTRDEFDAALKPLLDSLSALATRALADAGIAAADVQLLEIVGGGTRVPIVQTVLKEQFAGRAVSYHVNSDEGALFGASYFGAHVAPYALSVIEGFVGSLGVDLAVKDDAPADLSDATAVLAAWRERDSLEQVTVDSKNELESFLFATKALVSGGDNADLALFATQAAIDALRQFCEDGLLWLEADGSDALAVGRDEFVRRLDAARDERRAKVGAYELAAQRDVALEALDVALQAVPSAANLTSFASARELLKSQRAAVVRLRSLLAAHKPTDAVEPLLQTAAQIDARAAAVRTDLEKWREKVRVAEAKLKAKREAELSRTWLDDFDALVRKWLRRVHNHQTEIIGALLFVGLAGPLAWNWLVRWQERRQRAQFGGHRLGGRKFD